MNFSFLWAVNIQFRVKCFSNLIVSNGRKMCQIFGSWNIIKNWLFNRTFACDFKTCKGKFAWSTYGWPRTTRWRQPYFISGLFACSEMLSSILNVCLPSWMLLLTLKARDLPHVEQWQAGCSQVCRFQVCPKFDVSISMFSAKYLLAYKLATETSTVSITWTVYYWDFVNQSTNSF